MLYNLFSFRDRLANINIIYQVHYQKFAQNFKNKDKGTENDLSNIIIKHTSTDASKMPSIFNMTVA